MKFFLCILLIALVSADSPNPDSRGPARRFDFTKCCKLEKPASNAQFIESMAKLADQCKTQMGGPEPGKPPKFACFHECIGNESKILNADKTLNEVAYRTFVTTQMATEDYQKAVADGIATKCIEKIKSADSSEEQIQDGCSKVGLKAFHCSSKELINSCPVAQQDTSEPCVKFREFVNGDFKGMKPRQSRAAHNS